MDVRPIEADCCLNELLVAGELDAVLSPTPPAAFTEGRPEIRRLIADPAAAERAYYRKTGFFPIMHLVGLRRTLAERHPWLPARLFGGFVARSEEHTSELQSLMRISYAVFCLNQKKTTY